MSSSSLPGASRLKWAAGATLVLATFASLGSVFWASSREPSLESIRRAFAARRWGDVEAGLRRWLQGHPQDGAAWEMLGGLLFEQGRMEDALTALRQVRESDPGWVNAQTVIGEIATRQHRFAEAEQSFRRAAGRNRGAVEPLKRLVSLLSLERRPAEARSALRRLFQITRDPKYLADSILISELESEVRDLNSELEEFVKQTPDDPWLRRVWGLFLLSRGRSAEALPHLESAATAFEEDPVGRFALAECRLALGIPVDDLSLLGSPPSRAADAARWWVLRSRLAELRHQADETLENLRKAVSADPRNVESQFRLGQAMIRRGDRQGGQVHLDRAEALGLLQDNLKRELRRLVRERTDVDALVRIGRLCQQSGMNVEANEWFELAYQRDPRRRPPGFDQAQLAPVDDGPTVALSRPVLKESVQSRPTDYSPGWCHEQTPRSGSRILLCERASDFNTTQGPRHGSSSGTPWAGVSRSLILTTTAGSIFTL